MSGFACPKSEWGPGPWQDEPDEARWLDEITGLPCVARRNSMGAWCGYVGVGPGHPTRGGSYAGVAIEEFVDVHGGVTCAGSLLRDHDLATAVFLSPAGWAPDEVYFYGFDCNHFLDYAPASASWGFWRSRAAAGAIGDAETYRDLAFVRAECASLARQLAAMGARDSEAKIAKGSVR